MLLDAKLWLRRLRHAPLTTVVAVLTLAVGIGMNTAVFSLVNAVLLRPLPYPDADRLVWIAPFDEFFGKDTTGSRGDYLVFKEEARTLEKVTAYGTQDLAMVVGGEATEERVASIGGDFWAITGAEPSVGRLVQEGESEAIVLSHGLFERRFGGQSGIIGRTVEVAGTPFVVVGVLPKHFRVTFPQSTVPGDDLRDLDAFISLPGGHQAPRTEIPRTPRPSPYWVKVVGRLRPATPMSLARTELQTIHQRLEKEYPRAKALDRTLRVLPLADKLAEEARGSLLALLGAVVFVVLIATVNVANLLLGQTSTRSRETAIRTALGAGRVRLVRQFLIEGVVLSLLGGAIGVVVAHALVPVLVSMSPFAISGIADIDIDARVLGFTLLVSLGSGLLFGFAPIHATWRASPSSVLGGSANVLLIPRARLQGALVAIEIALAIVLLTGSAAMVRSLWNLQSYPPGFSPNGTYVMRIPLSGPRYEALEQKFGFVASLLTTVASTAGVDGVGIAASKYTLPIALSGASPGAPDATPTVAVRAVSSGYVRAMGASLVRGRWPAADEEFDMMVVNETFARTVAGGDPIGRGFSGGFVDGTIVGVVADLPSAGLDAGSMPELYYPYLRAPGMRSITVAIRMSASAVDVVRRLVEGLDRTQPLSQFRSLEDALSESIAPRRFNMFLLNTFALSALLMALGGTVGVVARLVASRTQEMAIRLTLGARPSALVLMVARQVMLYVGTGVVVGSVLAEGAMRSIRGLFHGVDPGDPKVLVAVSLCLTASAFVACCFPAMAVARVDPAQALRRE